MWPQHRTLGKTEVESPTLRGMALQARRNLIKLRAGSLVDLLCRLARYV